MAHNEFSTGDVVDDDNDNDSKNKRNNSTAFINDNALLMKNCVASTSSAPLDSSRSKYYDALSTTIFNTSIDLSDTISEAQIALNLFLNNKFNLAEERVAAFAHCSMYHALGHSTILFIKAIMTCEKTEIITAMDVIRNATKVINKFRPHYTITESIFKWSGQQKNLTNEEMHAELCLAEVLLFRAILTFFADDNFSSFLRGALKIRLCYQLYRECLRILQNQKCWHGTTTDDNDKLKQQFECGTRMGNGVFNLLLSNLPTKLLRLLEVIGFSGNQKIGFAELKYAALAENTLRAPMASLALLSWHLFGLYFVGTGQPDLTLCKRLLVPLINNYPNGAIVLLFHARIYLLNGDIENAIYFYNKSINSQNVYRQFQHACYWELLFINCYCRQWDRAANYAKRLFDENKWSICVYTYFLAILINADKKVNRGEETVSMLLGRIPSLRLRIAGKSIPMEKFCEHKAKRFQRFQTLYLPHYEFIYFWNGFTILERIPALLKSIFHDIESSWEAESNSQNIDDWCLYNFLRGVCLRSLNEPQKAEACFLKVIENEKQIVDFVYLPPNAHVELALICNHMGKVDEAISFMLKAKSYKGYPLETKLHFRIHSIMENLVWYKKK